LVADLQVDNFPVQLPDVGSPKKSSRWRVVVAAFVGSVLLGMLIGWGLYGNTRSPFDFTTDPGAKPDGIAPLVLPRRRSCTRSAGSPA
jgi:hypothetical protein